MKFLNLKFGFKTGGAIVVDTLQSLGITHIFSILGSQTLPIWDGLFSKNQIKVIVPRNERHGAFMAEGYGQAINFPAVLSSCPGPGVANELIGVYSAYKSNTPVLCIAPSHPPKKMERLEQVFQGLDHQQFFKGACKSNQAINTKKQLCNSIESAFNKSNNNKSGPVRVDISFPLLFKHYFYKKRGLKKGPAIARYNVLLISDLIGQNPWMVTGLTAQKKQSKLIVAGIKQSGYGLPLALGAKFASPSTPTVLITTKQCILENLGCLAVAKQNEIAIRIIANQNLGQSLLEIMSEFNIEFINAPNNLDTLAKNLLDQNSTLTLVVL